MRVRDTLCSSKLRHGTGCLTFLSDPPRGAAPRRPYDAFTAALGRLMWALARVTSRPRLRLLTF